MRTGEMDKAVGHLFMLDYSPYTNHRVRTTTISPRPLIMFQGVQYCYHC